MMLLYDCIYIKADKKIDIIKDYLDSLEECDIDKIAILSDDLQFFIDHYIESRQTMTDKQIIIDGVDVSECEFAEMFWDTHCRIYDYKYCIGKDCHYKNWQRKEQECEELKERVKNYGK